MVAPFVGGFVWLGLSWTAGFVWLALLALLVGCLLGIVMVIFLWRIGAPLTRVLGLVDRQQIEQLSEGEKRYRRLIDNANDVIYAHDLDGQLVSINKTGEELFGFSRAEILFMHINELLAPEHHANSSAVIRQVEREYEVLTGEFDVLTSQGRRITLESSLRLVCDDSGQPVGVEGIARDVSHRKAMQARLQQIQKMEAVGRLAGGVAHEFNNLLTVITGHSKLILDKMDPGELSYRQLTQISEAAERGADLTRQLLAYGQRQKLSPKILDVEALVKDIEPMLQSLTGAGVQLILSRSGEVLKIEADPRQLEQVLINLVDNACDAMSGAGTLTLETARALLTESERGELGPIPPGSYATVIVSDTGVGIDASIRAQIFEPFFTTKKLNEGTGLGLSTVYGIVEQSRGHLQITTQPGQGTRFRLYFPQVSGEVTVDQAPQQPVAGRQLEFASETILVVDDEKDVLELVSVFLASSGYRVLGATNGSEALDILEKRPRGSVDLILTDVVMPGLSGPDLLAQIRELQPQMRVLFMSGYSASWATRHGMPKDAPLVEKPFHPEVLLAEVRAVLEEAPSEDEGIDMG